MSGIINVWADTGSTPDERGSAPRIARLSRDVTSVSEELVAVNLAGFFRSFDKVVSDAAVASTMFSIEEIELSLVVTAKGGIELVGKLEGGAEASIKLKLKRKPAVDVE